jgi:hypothetical protein
VGLRLPVPAGGAGHGPDHLHLARNQFVAGQIAIIGTFLPAFLLSGFMFDIDSMPAVVQGITHVVVARYFVAIVQTLFLAGDVWAVILPNALALPLMAALLPRYHLAQVAQATGVMLLTVCSPWCARSSWRC